MVGAFFIGFIAGIVLGPVVIKGIQVLKNKANKELDRNNW